jgi:pyruvate carboxylase
MYAFECWGGATFDVAYRFLDESPWDRLRQMRQAAPNILLQMLLRGANAVGYTSYPDNVVKEFIKLSAKNGVDVFRVFDSLNGLDNMRLSLDTVRECNKVAEAALCYTGDILDPRRDKYDLKYYVKMAKELAKAGANIIAIKDMAGLVRPEAAYQLVSALKDAVDLPIHMHSHDGSGNAIYMYARAIDAGVDIVDTAMSALSCGTAQPSTSSLWYALSGNPRQPRLDVSALNEMSRYWETVRPYYKAADKTEAFPNPEVYVHEMPGGTVYQPETTIRSLRPAGSLGRYQSHVPQGFHDVRRSDQGYAFFQDRRRHDLVHGAERTDGRRYLRQGRHPGLPQVRGGIL